jgi:hypothetical protein
MAPDRILVADISDIWNRFRWQHSAGPVAIDGTGDIEGVSQLSNATLWRRTTKQVRFSSTESQPVAGKDRNYKVGAG